MSDLQTRFDQAQIDVKTLSERPNNMTLLSLYAVSYTHLTLPTICSV